MCKNLLCAGYGSINDWTQTRELRSALFNQTLMSGETLAVASNQNVPQQTVKNTVGHHMEPLARIELATFSLRVKRSAD